VSRRGFSVQQRCCREFAGQLTVATFVTKIKADEGRSFINRDASGIMAECLDGKISEHNARDQLIDGTMAIRVAQLFKALSDPSRVRIIAALMHRELCVHDLAAILDLSPSAVSHQLRSLREMQLVRFRREGRHVFYQLDDEHISELFSGGVEHVSHSGR
jgi:DNA-binding transcriptional ArsR family regulator